MPEDLRETIRRNLENETRASDLRPDLDDVIARGRVARSRRRITSSVAVAGCLLVLAGLGAFLFTRSPGGSDVERDESDVPIAELPEGLGKPLVEDMTPEQEAEVFVIEALVEAGLYEPMASLTYYPAPDAPVEKVESGYRVPLAANDCSPRDKSEQGYGHFGCRALGEEDPDTGNPLPDTWVTSERLTGVWRVVRVEGNMPAGAKARVEGYTAPRRNEPSHWEFPTFDFGNLPTGTKLVDMSAVWTGPIPTDAGGSVCSIDIRDETGGLLFSEIRYQEPPRLGHGRTFSFVVDDIDATAVDLDARCKQYAGDGWEVVSKPELIESPDGLSGAIARLEWQGPEGFTASATCSATIVDGNGELVFRGSGFVDALWRPGELRNYPYRTEAVITFPPKQVEEARIQEFSCRLR